MSWYLICHIDSTWMRNFINHDQRSRFEVYVRAMTDYLQKAKNNNIHIYSILSPNWRAERMNQPDNRNRFSIFYHSKRWRWLNHNVVVYLRKSKQFQESIYRSVAKWIALWFQRMKYPWTSNGIFTKRFFSIATNETRANWRCHCLR